MKKTIEIDGQRYDIDIEKTIRDGYLVKEKRYPKQGDTVVITKSYGYRPTTVIVVRVSANSYMIINKDDYNRFSDIRLEGKLSVENWDSYMTRLKIIDWKVIED